MLSNFTVKGVEEKLRQQAARYGIPIQAYLGEYGQWQQEILGEELYAFKLDIIYLVVDFEDAVSQISLIDQLCFKTSAKIIVCTKVDESAADTAVNEELVRRFKNNTQVHVFDFNRWIASLGKDAYWNTKYRELADMRLAPHAFELFANELVAYLVPLAGKTKKCLVLDLDNTLWGGVIGEDGLSGIALSPSGAGSPFYEFQRAIKQLQESGIILAINSRNNEADVAEVFAKHRHMLLTEDDFAAARINWSNKAQNMQELAQELNIGLESMVFIDDDPRNRELVASALPEMAVIDLPRDPREYVSALRSYKGFTRFSITDEDRKKAHMYADEKKRRKLKEKSIDLESFLRGLRMRINIHPILDEHVARASQLTQKTNQFNLTTRRYQEEEVKAMLASGARAWVLDAQDNFGEYGITGLIIARDMTDCWEIDTLLLSCRILGKRIECQFFGTVLNQLKEIAAKKVVGKYLPTRKNSQVRDFYRDFGFVAQAGASGEEDIWEHDLSDFTFEPLDFISTSVAPYE